VAGTAPAVIRPERLAIPRRIVKEGGPRANGLHGQFTKLI
jgi:hypothetical protein